MAKPKFGIKLQFNGGRWEYWGAANTVPHAMRIIGRFKAQRAQFQRHLAAGRIEPGDRQRAIYDVPVAARVLDHTDGDKIVHTENIG